MSNNEIVIIGNNENCNNNVITGNNNVIMKFVITGNITIIIGNNEIVIMSNNGQIMDNDTSSLWRKMLLCVAKSQSADLETTNSMSASEQADMPQTKSMYHRQSKTELSSTIDCKGPKAVSMGLEPGPLRNSTTLAGILTTESWHIFQASNTLVYIH